MTNESMIAWIQDLHDRVIELEKKRISDIKLTHRLIGIEVEKVYNSLTTKRKQIGG